MNFSAQEIRALTKLTLPILTTQLAQIGMGTVDTLMSGHVSTRDLAAVAIGTSLWLPVWLFLAGVLVALSPLAAAFNSGRRQQELPQLLSAALWCGIALGVVSALLLLAGALLLPVWIDDPETGRIASQYTLAIAAGMPAAGIFLAYRFYAEALNQPGHVTRIMLTGLVMNVPVNMIFIDGMFGLPALGGVGCGIGSSIVFTGMAIALARNTRKHRIPAGYNIWAEVLKPRFQAIKDILRIGIPIGIAIFFEVSLFTVIALFLTSLGPVIVAGHQVALNLSSLTFMIPLSLGMAMTVRVSHHLGSGDALLAQRTAWLGVKLNLGVALFNATAMVLFAGIIARFYSPDPEVVAVAAALLMYAAVFQLSDAIQIAAAGALRAYHDTFMVMVITFIAYWLVGLGVGYWLAFKAPEPSGAAGFWTGLILGLTTAAILLTIRLRRVSRTAVPA